MVQYTGPTICLSDGEEWFNIRGPTICRSKMVQYPGPTICLSDGEKWFNVRDLQYV